ncbi:MAG: HAD-IA family hydrolase [Candidatus Bathyarchaeia archaeon]
MNSYAEMQIKAEVEFVSKADMWSMVRAVLFDLDETLIDSFQGHIGAHAEVCRILKGFLSENGFDVDEGRILFELSRLDDEMNKRFMYDRDMWWPILVGKFAPKLVLPNNLIKMLTRSYWLAYAKAAKPYPDTEEVLLYLKERGYLLGLVSDSDRLPGMKRYRIEIQPFKNLFDLTLVAGEDTEETKPSPEPFLVAAEGLGVKPGECVYVGDKPFADVEGARKAGMKTILIYRRDWGFDAKPDLVLRSLSELKNIL